MKNDVMTQEDINRRFEEINALPAETASPEDKAAFAAAAAEDSAEALTLKEYKVQREYSGRLLLRIPKELHQSLAADAARNGVSLNQYALYKLSK